MLGGWTPMSDPLANRVQPLEHGAVHSIPDYLPSPPDVGAHVILSGSLQDLEGCRALLDAAWLP